ILFLGRLEEKKGVFDLVRAFAIVHAARPQTRLMLGGDGDVAAVETLARELGVAGAVTCPGWVGPAEKAVLLARAAVFVLPSHFEQMPMTILEAMSYGTPVVATDVGAIPDMLAHGKSGSVVPIKEIDELAASILRILTDNIRTDTLAMRGLERVQSEYMVETVILRLRRRYEELAA
ncbi:MAG: glycosyltransferase family 4 protein, partial [Gammaproteobacteria bacterium]